MEGEDWEKWSKKIPEGFKWEKVDAQRIHKKGRVAEGLIFGVRINKRITNGVFVISNNTKKWEGKCGEEKWRIVAVYNVCGWEKLLQELMEIGKEEHVNLLVLGDMNAQMGEKVLILNGGSEQERESKDQITNGDGEKMLQWVAEEGLVVLYGWKNGDEKGVDISGRERKLYNRFWYSKWEGGERELIALWVGERTESEHMPITMGEVGESKEQGSQGREWGGRRRYRWTEVGRFRKNLGERPVIMALMCPVL